MGIILNCFVFPLFVHFILLLFSHCEHGHNFNEGDNFCHFMFALRKSGCIFSF